MSVSQDYRILRGAWRFTAGTAAALNVGNDMVVSNATVFCERVSTGGQGTGRVFSANGNGSAGVYSAAGAGGSIMIQCASLSGNGTVYANGGTSAMAGGGGGRIAVWLTSGSDVGGVRLLACSGSSWPYGAAGTVYLQTSGQTEGAGTLVLDNLNRRAYIGDYRRGYGSRPRPCCAAARTGADSRP